MYIKGSCNQKSNCENNEAFVVVIEGRYPSTYDYPMSKQTRPKDGDPMLYIQSLGYDKKLKKNKFIASLLELSQKSFA